MKSKLIILLIFLVVLDSCQNRKSEYVARVGKKLLTYEELMKRLPDSGLAPDLSPTEVKSIVSAWVKKEVLYQQALAYHFDRDPNIKSRVEDFYRDLIADAYVKYYLQTNVVIGEDEIKEFYLKNKNSYTRKNDEARITHVVVQNFDDAMGIKSALLSHNKTVLDKYLLKYNFETKTIKRGEALSELDRTIFETPPRGILGPIATNYGYHIVEVLARYPAGSLKSLDEVRDEIYQQLTQIKIRENYDQLINTLLKDADYEIREDQITNFMSKAK